MKSKHCSRLSRQHWTTTQSCQQSRMQICNSPSCKAAPLCSCLHALHITAQTFITNSSVCPHLSHLVSNLHSKQGKCPRHVLCLSEVTTSFFCLFPLLAAPWFEGCLQNMIKPVVSITGSFLVQSEAQTLVRSAVYCVVVSRKKNLLLPSESSLATVEHFASDVPGGRLQTPDCQTPPTDLPGAHSHLLGRTLAKFNNESHQYTFWREASNWDFSFILLFHEDLKLYSSGISNVWFQHSYNFTER